MGLLKFDLRSAMQDYEARTGIRPTYESISQSTGISVDTLKSMGSRDDYNSTLKLIGTIAETLNCDPTRYLHWIPSGTPHPERD